MSAQTIRTLHVEDDAYQQQTIARYLQRIPDLAFDITCVDSEGAALAEFREQPRDLVILDYQLTEGNGLNCLRALREQDPLVPIIAISGTASGAVAAELLQSGADDYISKSELSIKGLTHSVQVALARTAAYRRRRAAVRPDPANSIAEKLERICKLVLSQWGPRYHEQLIALAQMILDSNATQPQVRRAFDMVCRKLEQESPFRLAELRLFLQPILVALELQQRSLTDEMSEATECAGRSAGKDQP